jgi:hypothetical protein
MGVTIKIAEKDLARCVTLPILIKKPMRNFACSHHTLLGELE